MKVGLIAFNWQFDTSLALWNLELYANLDDTIRKKVEFEQYCGDIPDSYGEEEAELFKLIDWIKVGDFDMLGFSCYVWNIDLINKVATMAKALHPQITIIYGGQQIRGGYIEQLLHKEKCADILIEDEGEVTFRDLLLHKITGFPVLETIGGLHYLDQNGDRKSTGAPNMVADLGEIPSAYDGNTELPYRGSFLMEASRGCPYRCGYCLWAEPEGVREYDIKRVEAELIHVLNQKPSHIMFCDGTFNMRKERSKHIMKIMIKHLREGKTEPFSCLVENRLEIIDEESAQLLDELLDLNPLLTVEFGLQSANPESSKFLRRRFSQEKFSKAWNLLSSRVRANAEVDCIYALPGEDSDDFKRTVDYAYSLSPHTIQCFRLSVLPGTNFEDMAEEYGLKYNHEPNHAVYSTKWLTVEQIEWLEGFGYAVNDLYMAHGGTIASVLGQGLSESFSALISSFVDYVGPRNIFSCLKGNREPAQRGRYINLSSLFNDFIEKAIPADHIARDRIISLMKYETLLGSQNSVLVASEDMQENSSEYFVSNAVLFNTNYNIEEFIAGNRFKPTIDIMAMDEKNTLMALPQNVTHRWVKYVPKSMEIDQDYATVINTFRGGREKSEGVSMLGKDGYTEGRLDPIFSQLLEHGLLFSNNKEGAVL